MVKRRRKVALDTNILISALGWRGNPHKILQRVIEGELELFMSDEQFEELSRVLEYPKFAFSEDQKRRFKALISEIATFVRALKRLDIVEDDPSDNRILECALVANLDFIISGDEHLLSLGELGRMSILNASDFLKIN